MPQIADCDKVIHPCTFLVVFVGPINAGADFDFWFRGKRYPVLSGRKRTVSVTRFAQSCARSILIPDLDHTLGAQVQAHDVVLGVLLYLF